MLPLKAQKIKPKSNSKTKRSSSASKQRTSSIPLIKKICEKEREKLFSTFRVAKSRSSSREKDVKTDDISKRDYSFLKKSPRSLTLGDDTSTQKPYSRLSFKKMLQDAKELLKTQNSLIDNCDKLTREISNNQIEMESKFSQNENSLGVLNQAILSFKEKQKAMASEISQKKKNCIECDSFKSFMVMQLNSLNELIGKLGYNYVFHKFKEHNFIPENIEIYFNNVKQLITLLTQQSAQSLNLIQHQKDQIQNYQNTIMNYQRQIQSMSNYNNNLNRDSNNFLNENSNDNNRENITNSDCTLSTNLFNSNVSMSLSQAQMINSINNNTSNFNYNQYNNRGNDNQSNSKPEDREDSKINGFNHQETPVENEKVKNEVSSSNLFESKTFFEGYKRNKELRGEYELDHHYTDEGGSVLISNSFEKNSIGNNFSKTQGNFAPPEFNVERIKHSNTFNIK